ncbi:hypothetical protein DC415_23920 [Agrobacterium tumefaciens]|uniref:Uncharacterized protein n=1 Tax=Rhizobium rhizogenes TaxID=359 RepID=A0AA92BYS2_RHIRH|nr:hypothetical protein DC430_23540 [Rhizobium rhizogenes]PVE61999.1 hypothetical protein DC415_23920 [Agrobacterium tumefaciens]PVE69763.1 hypothetical protein DCP16_23920 [Sphingomonas sp. TPD3009]
MKWIVALAQWLHARRGAPFDRPLDLDEAMRIALERFPNDPMVQKAKAVSELYMRNLLGKRLHDA